MLRAGECSDVLVELFDDDERYRSIIDMQRYRFGSGVYKYFQHPLPASVQQLREALYEPLARIGNEWADRMEVPRGTRRRCMSSRSIATSTDRPARRR